MKRTGAALAIYALEQIGVRFTFGIPGVQNTELYDELREFATRYPDPRSAVMPALRAAQERYGWLTPEALREAREETGIEAFEAPVGERILDVDVHPIPAHGSEPAHFHYDIRYLLTVSGPLPPFPEGCGLFTLEQALVAGVDESLARALRKAADRLRGFSPVPNTHRPSPTI